MLEALTLSHSAKSLTSNDKLSVGFSRSCVLTSYSTVLRSRFQGQIVDCRKTFVVLRELVWTLSISVL